MSDRQRDLTLVDRRGVEAAEAVRDLAAQVDTGAMFEQVRHPRRRWVGPTVAVAATAVAVIIAVVVAVQPPVTVGGLDPASNGPQRAPAGLDDDTWPPAIGTVGPDGWVEVPAELLPTAGDPQDLAVVNGAFVLATEGGQVWTSDDGFAWAPVHGVVASAGERLFVGRAEGSLVVAGSDGAVYAGDLAQVEKVAQAGQIEGLAGGPTGGVVVSSSSDGTSQLMVTTDGRGWEPVSLETSVRSVAWDGSHFIAVTDGPDARLLQAQNPAGPWAVHPGSDTLPPGWWGVESTEPGFVLVPRADGDQGLDPLRWWSTDGGWITARLPTDGPVVIDDATTLGDGELVAMGTDSTLPELDADRLYRIEPADGQATAVETGEAFGPTTVLRQAHAAADGDTAMVAYGRRRAGPGDGLTVWVHRPVDDATQTWWCPPAATTAAEALAANEDVELISARMSTVGDVRAWQDQPANDPAGKGPLPDPEPQSWLESLAPDLPAVVCTYQADGFQAPGGPYPYASFIATPGGNSQPYGFYPSEPAPTELGPDDAVPQHDAPPGDRWITPDTETVDVPNVVGLTEDEARTRLNAVGIAVTVFTKVTDDPDQIGRVLGQSPPPGATSSTPPATATTDTLTVVLQVGLAPPDPQSS